MAFLEILRPGQPSQRQELSRSEPVLVGRLEYSTIRIDENDVAPIVCRIGWSKSGFEATSANPQGVSVNGHLVAQARLSTGDLIQVGTCTLVFQAEQPAAYPAAAPVHKEPAKAPREPRVAEPPAREARHSPKARPAPVLDDGPDVPESVELPALAENPRFQGSRINTARGADLPAKLKVKNVRSARPGEQDALRSPLVLGLGGGALVLLLATAAIWFLMGREVANRLYDRGVTALGDGQFAQAIQAFDQFVERYPRNGLVSKAMIGSGKARILQEIGGAAPSWERGLEQLQEFVKQNRNSPEFSELEPTICEYAEQIAVGAAKTAEATRDEQPLAWSADAQLLLERHSDPQQPPVTSLERIRVATDQARRAIVKQQSLDTALAAMTAAIEAKKPLDALRARAELLQRYPDLATQGAVQQHVKTALEQELSTVAELAEPIAAIPAVADPSPQPLVPTPLARARTDEASEGRRVLVVSKGVLYAVDSITGEPAWRRNLGDRAVFFPIRVPGGARGIIAYFQIDQSVRLLREEDGLDVWRQELHSQPTDAPLIHGGQVYLPLEDRRLARIEIDSGRLSGALTLSQRPVTTPCLSRDEATLFVPGEHSLIYAISLNPFAAVSLTFTQHASGSVVVPPLALGRLLLLCENDRESSGRLRLWNADEPRQPLSELKGVSLNGVVRDPPVVRGPQLVVPLTNGRLEAFAVRDDPERPGLVPIAGYQVPGTGTVPMQLSLGPDGQFWLASNAFRKFQLTSDSIGMDQNAVAAGLATQPLQSVGDDLFVARRPLWASGVQLSRVDRDQLSSPWRITLGAGPLAVLPTASGLTMLTENGEAVSISAERLRQGGLDPRGSRDIEWPVAPARPLLATTLPDGRCAVLVPGHDSQSIAVVSPAGIVDASLIPPAPLDVAPAPLEGGLILPLAGSLAWRPLRGTDPPPQDFILPITGDVSRHWTHVTALNETTVLACDDSGECRAIEWKRGDLSHLAERAILSLAEPLALPPVGCQGQWFLADRSGRVIRVSEDLLELQAERGFEAGVSMLATVEGIALAQSTSGTLHSLPIEGDSLASLWSAELGPIALLSAAVVQGEQLVLAGTRGDVLLLNRATGAEIRRLKLPQRLSRLISTAAGPVAIAADGSLYLLTVPPGGQP